MRIDATDDARRFIEEHGGKVYVWAGSDEISHASPNPPDEQIEFEEVDADGFTFFQDTTIGDPEWWMLEFHHLPHAHVTATWDGGIYSSSTEAL